MNISPVLLHIYDISCGIAARLSPILLGREIPGLWHTTIVVGDTELSYGPPLRRFPAGRSPLGAPSRVIELGETSVIAAVLDELVMGMVRPDGQFSEVYDILYNNCNTFANEMASILTGGSVPADVMNQSQIWLESPMLGELLLGGCHTSAAGGHKTAAKARQSPPTNAHGSGAGPSQPHTMKSSSALGATPACGPAPSSFYPPSAGTQSNRLSYVSDGRAGAMDELLTDLLRSAGRMGAQEGIDESVGCGRAVRHVASLWEEVAKRFAADGATATSTSTAAVTTPATATATAENDSSFVRASNGAAATATGAGHGSNAAGGCAAAFNRPAATASFPKSASGAPFWDQAMAEAAEAVLAAVDAKRRSPTATAAPNITTTTTRRSTTTGRPVCCKGVGCRVFNPRMNRCGDADRTAAASDPARGGGMGRGGGRHPPVGPRRDCPFQELHAMSPMIPTGRFFPSPRIDLYRCSSPTPCWGSVRYGDPSEEEGMCFGAKMFRTPFYIPPGLPQISSGAPEPFISGGFGFGFGLGLGLGLGMNQQATAHITPLSSAEVAATTAAAAAATASVRATCCSGDPFLYDLAAAPPPSPPQLPLPPHNGNVFAFMQPILRDLFGEVLRSVDTDRSFMGCEYPSGWQDDGSNPAGGASCGGGGGGGAPSPSRGSCPPVSERPVRAAPSNIHNDEVVGDRPAARGSSGLTHNVAVPVISGGSAAYRGQQGNESRLDAVAQLLAVHPSQSLPAATAAKALGAAEAAEALHPSQSEAAEVDVKAVAAAAAMAAVKADSASRSERDSGSGGWLEVDGVTVGSMEVGGHTDKAGVP